ncbi:hypothetical protein Lal_00006306 [Lupinus albus]|uniref:Putative small monomeric GTPase n=1 Tax=Lupinus albus TaxID=3870 RepID=A0A6A4Q8B2_LUPAL|nr:putative small monomeric GTPase [Lupinus albus]KAF1875676.1 hypothetical protein Lal_00006306 [Lupinus albus]
MEAESPLSFASLPPPIRAPLTLYNSLTDSDSDFHLSPSSLSHSHSSLSPTLRVTPFAHLSTYDDDYYYNHNQQPTQDEDDEEEQVFSVVSLPHNFVPAPRINVLDVEQDFLDNFMFMDSSPTTHSLHTNKFTFFNHIASYNFSEAQDDDASGGIRNALVLDEHDREACDQYSLATDTDVMSQNSQHSSNNEQFDKVEVVLNESEEENLIPKLTEADSTVHRKFEYDTREAKEMVGGISVMDGDISVSKSNFEDYDNNTMQKQNTASVNYLQEMVSQLHTDFSMIGENVSEGFAENVEYSAPQSSASNGSQSFDFDQQDECEKLVSITESMLNSKAKLHDSYASFESNDDDYCEGNKIRSVESFEPFDATPHQENTYLKNDLSRTVLGGSQEDELVCEYLSHENVEVDLNLVDTVEKEVTVDTSTVSQESEGDGSASDEGADCLMPVGLEQFKEHIVALSVLLGAKRSGKNCNEEQTGNSSHGKLNLSSDDAKRELNHVGGESNGDTVTVTISDESHVIFPKEQSSFKSLQHCEARAGFKGNISKKEKEKVQKIEDISVKFLRVVQRVNLSSEDSMVSNVLCKLVADIGRRSNQELVIESAKLSAKKVEEDCQDDLDFSLNILVLGKSGVGKSATINSLFSDVKVITNAFETATTSIKEVSGTVNGVKIRILDTPGLRSSMKEQDFNRKILSSIKRHMKKFPVDVILYVDRVDVQTRDLNDLPMLRSITSSLGPSIWRRTILALTHAASTPLDGPSGSPLRFEVFVAQKSFLVQQSITQAVRGVCELSPSFIFPVSLVENHPLCGKNICGESVLPNGLRWRSQLLALCFSMKILSEVPSMEGHQNIFDQWMHLFYQNHSLPLSHLFSSLLQSPAHLKFSADRN